MSVYVLNMRGESLMPTSPAKARILLKQKKAKVVKRTPFTIQLQYATGETKQPISLGIDAGYSKIGFSAVSDKRELISGEVSMRMNVSKRISNRAMYRRNRRNRLWYRKPRFLNRVGSKKKGWFAPSIQHKLDTHIRLVEKIKQILPITETIVEVASFDTQRMQNPNISGMQYQQGTLFGYTIRNYLLEKWNHRCIYCRKSNISLEVEHIIPKSRGGSDRIDNLTISCRRCNLKKGNMTATEFGFPNIQKEAEKTYRGVAFMNAVRYKMVEDLGPDCRRTYGDITKYKKTRLGLSKSHANDAFVIAGGTYQIRGNGFEVSQVRRNNRKLQLNRKGFKPSIRRQRYDLQPNDLVRYKNQLFRVKGVHCRGKRAVIDFEKKKKSIGIGDAKLIIYGKGLHFKETPIPPTTKVVGFLGGIS